MGCSSYCPRHKVRVYSDQISRRFGIQLGTLEIVRHYRWGGEARSVAAQRGLHDHGAAVVQQAPELLGEALARHRPQPRAGAAGQDDGDDPGLACSGIETIMSLSSRRTAIAMGCPLLSANYTVFAKTT